VDKFLPMVLDMEEEGLMSPILVHEKTTFVYIKHNNLYRILHNCVDGGQGEWENFSYSGPFSLEIMCKSSHNHQPCMDVPLNINDLASTSLQLYNCLQ